MTTQEGVKAMPTVEQWSRSYTYYSRKDAHLCVRCGRQTERTIHGKTRCAECEEAAIEARRYLQRRRMVKGQCIWCGNPAEGRLCSKCREIEREYQREYKKRKSSDAVNASSIAG